MKKIVVCANFGSRDYIKDPVLEGYNPEWEYIYFTDQDVKSDYWDVRKESSYGEPRKMARRIKQRTHTILDFDICLWIDATMTLKVNPDLILERLGDADFLTKVHPVRTNSDQEIDACKEVNHFGEAEAEKMRKFFAEHNYSPDGLYENGLYIKRNNQTTQDVCDIWSSVTNQVTELRDQIAFPYVIEGCNLKIATFTIDDFHNWVEYVKHGNTFGALNIRYVTPYATHGNLGAEYNKAAEWLKDDDWICFLDGDTSFLDVRYGKWIEQTIKANPDYDIFGCMTNRLRDNQQRLDYLFGVTDIIQHRQVTEKEWEKHGTTVLEATRPLAGLLLLMKVSTLRTVKFKNGLLLLDTDFCDRAKKLGFKIGIMRGIYLFHYYRLAEGAGSTKHLRHW